ncbi:MAG: hypothetical protein PUF10_02800 [Bacteroidales bacterium]|nr:hypothetical protein [Bacteroidales bacterium]
MKAYKGFNQDLTCRGYQYEEGKTYETDKAQLCKEGFHACENPIDCLHHYSPAQSLYHEVELDGVSDEREDGDTKIVGKKIKVGAKIGIPQICQLTFDYVKSHCTNEHNAEAGKPATAGDSGAATAGDSGAATAGYRGAATAGDSGAATAGDSGAATAGDRGAATAGDYGAATAGDYGAATAGDSGAATAGYRGAATAGDYGAATAGYSGAATAGDYGAATSRGSSASGEKGLSVARGNNVKVKGGIGALLVIAEERSYSYDIKEWKAVVVDGETIKADTWYQLVDGELKEVQE